MVIFYGANGEKIKNPSEDFIKEFVNKEAEYWQEGSGDSSFEVDGSDETLIMFYEEPYGFFIMRHPDYLVPYDENEDTEVIEHNVGGEPMMVPVCCFVSREDAFSIILEYINNETFSDEYNWTDLYDIEFDGNDY